MAKKLSGFEEAFADARKKMGAGKTFTYQGKSYSTNRADDGMASSPRPKPRPAMPAPQIKGTSRSGGLRTPPAASAKPAASAGGDMPRVDTMGNAYRKGGMVAKPKTMSAAMKKYEGSAADMKADKAGAKKMMGNAAPAKGKSMPAFMKKGK